MTELERELAALRAATASVKASAALKSAVLAQAASAGAALPVAVAAWIKALVGVGVALVVGTGALLATESEPPHTSLASAATQRTEAASSPTFASAAWTPPPPRRPSERFPWDPLHDAQEEGGALAPLPVACPYALEPAASHPWLPPTCASALDAGAAPLGVSAPDRAVVQGAAPPIDAAQLEAAVLGVLRAARADDVVVPDDGYERVAGADHCRASEDQPRLAAPRRLAEPRDHAAREALAEARAYRQRMGRDDGGVVVLGRVRLGGPPSGPVLCDSPVGPGGWFATVVDDVHAPLWCSAPGFEPVRIALDELTPGEWDLGQVPLRAVSARTGATIDVVVDAPAGVTPRVSLHPHPCPPNNPSHGWWGLDAPAWRQQTGRRVRFPRLSLTGWRVVIDAPGMPLMERWVSLEAAGTAQVHVRLEPALHVSAEVRSVPAEAGPRRFCAARSKTLAVAPGQSTEELVPTVSVRTRQEAGRLFLWSVAAEVSFVGNAPLDALCGDVERSEPWARTRPVQHGDVVRVRGQGTDALVRFSVREGRVR